MKAKDSFISLFSSEEMKESIERNYHKISPDEIISVICTAIISLEEKLRLLELHAKEQPENQAEYTKTINCFQQALSLQKSGPGDIFIIAEICNCEIIGFEPYVSFEKAMEYIREEYMEFAIEPKDKFWYELEKWTVNENGDYTDTITYTVLGDGTVIDYHQHPYEDDPKRDNINHYMTDPNLPVPFQPGDVVISDCLPFYSSKICVITEKDDGDCCSPFCLFVTEKGELETGALKHNAVFREHFRKLHAFQHISPLHNLRKYQGELPAETEPLKDISKVLSRLSKK